MAKIITERTFTFELPEGKKKERLDHYLANNIENASRNRMQQLIEAELVTVNGKTAKSSYKVQPKDLIVLTIPTQPHPDEAEAEDIPINIVYEDDHLLVLNKPPGMVVHPSYSNWTGTLVNALLHHTKDLSEVNTSFRPGIVHRIDKDTSGLLVIAKEDYVLANLSGQFAKHSTEREYWAVVWGVPKERKGTIEYNITRSKKDRKVFTHSVDEGKTAFTYYEVIEEFEFASLIKLKLKTGRTHQIRVHLSAINHPIFGDPVYRGRELHYGASLPKMKSRLQNLLEIMPRQALHAKTLGFMHPVKEEFMRFDSELPDDMKLLIEKLKTE